MSDVTYDVSIPPELLPGLDRLKEQYFKDQTYDEMLTYLVKEGLDIVDAKNCT